MMNLTRFSLASVLLAGCGGLQLTMLDSAYRRPSNVAVYFAVDTTSGDPVPNLTADDFRIYEDGELVSVAESQQTIVNPEVAAEHFTLVLVDMSGSVSDSEQVPLIEEATLDLTSQLSSQQRVGIYAFDGREDIHRVAPFTASRGGAARSAMRLGSFVPRDPSTNLHGAVVNAVATLDEALARSRAPLRFGTVVLFTDGTDRAARVTREEMMEAIDGSPYDFFAIGVGDEISEDVLSSIGREGFVSVNDRRAIQQAFGYIAERILALTQRYYLLSYCSPARAGEHVVTVEAVSGSGRGDLSYAFDATGFGPRCDPSRPPPFSTRTGGATPRRRQRRERGVRIEVSAQKR